MENRLQSNTMWCFLLGLFAFVLLCTPSGHARLRIEPSRVTSGDPKGPTKKNKLLPDQERGLKTVVSNDPIRFTIQPNKQRVSVGEPIDLTITAQLLDISPNLMFFLPGSNAYTLKMIMPAGFQVTGGDLTEFVTGELIHSSRTVATYHLQGYFTSASQGTCFQLLRSHGQATSQSLFEKKATLCLSTQPAGTPLAGARTANALYVTDNSSTFSWCAEAETNNGIGNRTPLSDAQASGGYFVNSFGGAGEYMEYTITNVPTAGFYTLHLWYTSGETPQFGLVLNAPANAPTPQTPTQTFSASGTGRWSGPFVEATTTLTLNQGTNTLRIQGTGSGNFSLDKLCIDGGGCAAPNLSLGSPTCSGDQLTYSVAFTAQAGAAVTTSAGTVVGNQVTGIAAGSVATLTATLDGCSSQQTTTAPTCSNPPASYSWCSEAETNNGVGNRSAQSDGQASGGAYVGGFGSTGEYMEYTIAGVPTAGFYTLHLWYNSGETPQFGLILNGASQVVVAPGTGRWQSPFTTEKTISLSLNQGTNTLRIQGTGNGNFSLDRLCVDGGSTPPFCNLTLTATASNASPTCGAIISLNALCNGPDCNGQTYTWSTGQTGQTVSVTVPNSNGNTTYTVTATKTGCSSTTAAATVVVSGCDTTTFNWQVPTSEVPWDGTNPTHIGVGIPIGNYYVQENTKLKLEVRAGFGGLNQIYDKVTNQYLINSPDQGRGDGFSSYTGPQAFSADAPYWHTGYNPLKNGDSGNHPSTMLFHSKINIGGKQYIYTKTKLLSWSHTNTRELPVIYEEWRTLLDDNKLDIWTRITHSRDDLTDYGAYQQEWPLMMINGARYVRYYNGDAPYTKAPTTSSNSLERMENNNYVVANREFGISEPWIGVEIGPNRMIAQYAPWGYRTAYNWMNPQNGDNNDGGFQGMYTSFHPLSNFDAKGVWLKHHVWIIDSEDNVRNFVYSQNHNTVPNYSFNQSTGRNGWVGWDKVTDQQEPFTDNQGWKTNWLGKTDNGVTSANNAKIRSPYTSFKASDCPTLYIKGAYTGSRQAFQVNWTEVGQEPELMNGNFPNENAKRTPKGNRSVNQYTNFTMQGDGVSRVYTVNMGWSTGYINQFEIAQGSIAPNEVIVPGQQFRVEYIGCTNPGN